MKTNCKGYYCNKKGEWHIDYTICGKRRVVYLGRDFNASRAASIAKVVRRIAVCHSNGSKIPDSDRQAVLELPPNVQTVIQRHGLLDPKPKMQRLIDDFLASRAGSIGLDVYKEDARWCKRLLEYFKGEYPTADGVGDFRVWCFRIMNEVTYDRGYRRCRMIMAYGIEKGYLLQNPFPLQKSRKDTNQERSFTVEKDLATRVLAHCDDDYVRLGFILARFAGLRVPSEIREMRFKDFDNPEFFLIHWNTKTGTRAFPLQKIVKEYIDRLRVGKCSDDFVFPRKLVIKGALFDKVQEAICKAGIAPWPKLFINCRATVISEYMAAGVPEVILDEIFGNSAKVRKKHYWNFRTNIEMQKLLQIGNSFEINFEAIEQLSYVNQKQFDFDKLN